MSLYWCVFDGERELDGIDAGSYGDFNALRRTVAGRLEGGRAGSRFPVFAMHSDCEGEWSPADCRVLEDELAAMAAELRLQPPVALEGWQRRVAESAGFEPRNAFECFIDADGQPLLGRLRELAALSRRTGRSILFQ